MLSTESSLSPVRCSIVSLSSWFFFYSNFLSATAMRVPVCCSVAARYRLFRLFEFTFSLARTYACNSPALWSSSAQMSPYWLWIGAAALVYVVVRVLFAPKSDTRGAANKKK